MEVSLLVISTAQIAEMRAAGMTVAEISGAFGASYRSVRYAVTKMIDSGDIPPRAERYGPGEKLTLAEMVAARKSDEEIAAALGRTTQAVRRKRLRMGHKTKRLWDPSDDRRLAEMVAARKSDEEIAAALGRTASAVIERRRRLKLRRR